MRALNQVPEFLLAFAERFLRLDLLGDIPHDAPDTEPLPVGNPEYALLDVPDVSVRGPDLANEGSNEVIIRIIT